MTFCEGRMWGYPEYASAYSSIFLLIFGFLGLYRCPKQNLFGQLVFALMVVTGFGSFGYHWVGSDMWKYFDGNPMIIAGAMAALFTFDEVIRVYTSRVHPYAAGEKDEHSSLLAPINAIFWSAFAVVALWMDVQPEFSSFSQLSFQVPVAGTVLAVIFARFVTHKERLNDDWKILLYAKIGIALIVLSAGIWIITEKNCETYPWLAYFHGHLIWHLGMAWGVYLTLQFVLWFTAHRFGCRPYFMRGPWWNTIIPVVEYDLNPVVMPVMDPSEPNANYRDDARHLLATVPSFLPLTPPELRQLAQEAHLHLHPKPETIIQKGETGNSLFVVAAGQLEVLHPGPEGATITLSRGAIVGEMSLLTGQLRSATVRTLTATVLYEIQKDALLSVLTKRPSLIAELGALLSHRMCGSQEQSAHFKQLISENC
jgi:hypothetical protein